jgi:hypothetical protein
VKVFLRTFFPWQQIFKESVLEKDERMPKILWQESRKNEGNKKTYKFPQEPANINTVYL